MCIVRTGLQKLLEKAELVKTRNRSIVISQKINIVFRLSTVLFLLVLFVILLVSQCSLILFVRSRPYLLFWKQKIFIKGKKRITQTNSSFLKKCFETIILSKLYKIEISSSICIFTYAKKQPLEIVHCLLASSLA